MLTKNHDQLTVEVKKHIESDALVQGTYWDGSHGGFVGCLAHSSDAVILGDRFGLPEPLIRICENIFESLEPDDAKDFFAALPAAVGRDGKDLTRVHWAFLAAELRALPSVAANIQAVIDPVIDGMDLTASGKNWPAVAWADACADAAAYAAACAATNADAAAYAATYAAAACADADAARIRQRDTILRMIAQAPVVS